MGKLGEESPTEINILRIKRGWEKTFVFSQPQLLVMNNRKITWKITTRLESKYER